MKLHHHPLSGHVHRVHAFLALLGVPFELVPVDLGNKEQKAPAFLAKNPFGQIPLLEDGEHVIADSNAILVYLAKRYGPAWLPEEPLAAAAVQRWLSVAAGEVAHGLGAARAVQVFRRGDDPAPMIARGQRVLALLDDHLAERDWVAAATPTIADIALYGYTARAPEGNIDLAPYPRVRGWLARIEALPGFVPFARTPVGLAAATHVPASAPTTAITATTA